MPDSGSKTVNPRQRPRPLWFWNGPLSAAATRSAIAKMDEQCGYGGFAILPAHGLAPSFMSKAFLNHYRIAVEEAESRGMKVCLYDEYWFPSGSAGGLLGQKFPEALSRRLVMNAFDVRGPATMRRKVADGVVMSAVAMRRDTLERTDISRSVSKGWIQFSVPPGVWRIMVFTCVPDGRDGLVDYLEPECVQRFIELTYDEYYKSLKRHFGKTIDSAFYDEPTMHRVHANGMWTERFNDVFERTHKLDPKLLYPALFYDIGPDTAWARNLLFSTRAQMFADGFVKTLAEWCEAHGIELTGHVDQEEVVNPTNLCGDLIKCFEHQHIPGVDQIFEFGRGSEAYKIVSSAATLYGRDRVMVECHGGETNMPLANLYREAMDLFAKGVNLMVPHAVWYDKTNVIFPPELSEQTAPYAAELPAYSQWIARLQEHLQGGELVADIGLIYPIENLRAGYRFDELDQYAGGLTPIESDYLEVAEELSLRVRRDFVYLHPEVLEERGVVSGGVLRVKGSRLHDGVRILIIPGGDVCSVGVLKMALKLVRAGGTVIATTKLPTRSSERHGDEAIRQLVKDIFGKRLLGRSHRGGGQSIFVSNPNTRHLLRALKHSRLLPDIELTEVPEEIGQKAPQGGSLSCCHRKIDGKNVFFIANSSFRDLAPKVHLRGHHQLIVIDPKNGKEQDCVVKLNTNPRQPRTSFNLSLPANTCRLLIEKYVYRATPSCRRSSLRSLSLHPPRCNHLQPVLAKVSY